MRGNVFSEILEYSVYFTFKRRKPPPPVPHSKRNETEISCFIKYIMFGANILIVFCGMALLTATIWAWTEDKMVANITLLLNSGFDPMIILLVAECLMFVIAFTGCTGALRENTTFLTAYCLAIVLMIVAEAVVMALCLAYSDWLEAVARGQIRALVAAYYSGGSGSSPRREAGSQLLDWLQQDGGGGLGCCGADGPHDWELNRYYRCGGRDADACGVPASCCQAVPGELLRNQLCGRQMRHPRHMRLLPYRVHTAGCVAAGRDWLLHHAAVPIAVAAAVMLVLQILAICFALILRRQVIQQRAKWFQTLRRSQPS